MNLQSFRKMGVASFFAASCLFSSNAVAQQQPLTVTGPTTRPMRVAERNNVYCAGYVTSSPIDTSTSIVGGYNEQDGSIYSQFNYVYVNLGSASGAKVGDILSVVRQRGQVKTKWTKKDRLGMYVQEVGSLEVVRLKGDHAVARVHTSCDNFLLGDLVRPMEDRVAPMFQDRPAMDLFADYSGKATGRLFMARDNQEVLTRDNVVYVDLGAEDNVRVGDYMTVFRPLGKGNPFENDEKDSVAAHVSDFGSFEYKGGGFSSQAGHKSGENARGKVVNQERAKDGRPEIRKVVGELVVLNVKERTATAMIVRNAQEIHTGDWVEVQ